MPVYESVCSIAQGGMATVDLVVRREGSFLRPYAMKRFHTRGPADAELEQMFLDEARIAGLLRHPNVVSVLDVGKDDGGPYLIMDYVEGVSLSELIRAHLASTEEPIPVQICLRVLVQAARGLAAAHELRSPAGAHLELVHRDISPQNILIDLSGTVRVADFGVARATGRTAETERGILKGKLGYLAPETLRFDDVDHRADLFAFGIVAFELFTRRRLYGGSDVKAAAHRILHDPAPDLGMLRPDAPDTAVDLVFRLLAKDPAHRPQSARDVADVLDELLVERVSLEGARPLDAFLEAHVDPTAIERRRAELAAAERRPPTVDAPSALPRRRTPVLAGAFALAVAGASGVLGWALLAEEPEPPEQPSAAAAPQSPPPVDMEPSTVEPEPEPEPEESAAQLPAEPDAAPSPAAHRQRRARPSPARSAVPVVRVY